MLLCKPQCFRPWGCDLLVTGRGHIFVCIQSKDRTLNTVLDALYIFTLIARPIVGQYRKGNSSSDATRKWNVLVWRCYMQNAISIIVHGDDMSGESTFSQKIEIYFAKFTNTASLSQTMICEPIFHSSVIRIYSGLPFKYLTTHIK